MVTRSTIATHEWSSKNHNYKIDMKKMQKLHVVIAVQAMCRGYLARARARIMLRSTIRTQALVRGYVVRQRMRRARLLGMTYDQFLEHEGYQAHGSEPAETPARATARETPPVRGARRAPTAMDPMMCPLFMRFSLDFYIYNITGKRASCQGPCMR